MPSKDAIKIFLRLRPHDGAQGGSTGCYEINHSFEESVVKYHIDRRQVQDYGINNSKEDFSYRFDRIFDQKAKQEEVFDTVAKDCVQNVIQGYNSTVFAYGQTGSGKTFSITGGTASYADRGLIPRCISMIFDEIKKQPDVRFSVHISYLQIYNEKGQDLLNRGRDAESLEDLPTVTYQEGEDDLTLKGLDAHPAQSVQDALNLLFLGDTNRLYTETSMNKTSTRSHCIFSVMLEAREAGSLKVRRSKLNLVDLAGSERVGKTGVSGQLLTEAKYINLSLHYLEAVIVALSEKKPFIPYRNSFMTMVLRDSLGGNCKTSMLATGHLGEKYLMETISTCRFAQRVASIKQKATVNESTDPAVLVRQLRQEVAQLKDQVAFLSSGKDADPSRTLTSDEMARCNEAVQKFMHDDDPSAQIVGVSGDLARVFACFHIMKKLCKGQKISLSDKVAADDGDRSSARNTSNSNENILQEKIRHLQTAAQQKENELGLLFQVVQRHNAAKAHAQTQTYADDWTGQVNAALVVKSFQTIDSNSEQHNTTHSQYRPNMINGSIMSVLKNSTRDEPAQPVEIHPLKPDEPVMSREQVLLAAERDRLAEGYELDTLSDPKLLTDRALAFEAFRKSYRKVEQIERTKAELDAKIPEAKQVAVAYNATVDEIKAAKRKIQQLRAERALSGDMNADSDPDSEESYLLARIRNELRPRLDADKKSLSELKERIDHIQLLVRRASDQLVKDFDTWFTLRKQQVHQSNSLPPASEINSSRSARRPISAGSGGAALTLPPTRVSSSKSSLNDFQPAASQTLFTKHQRALGRASDMTGQNFTSAELPSIMCSSQPVAAPTGSSNLSTSSVFSSNSHGNAFSRFSGDTDEDAAIAADLAKMYKARDTMRAQWQQSQIP